MHHQRPSRELRPTRHRAARAFTLVEVVTSLAIISILLLAMGSAVVLAGRALPRPDDATSRLVADSRIIDQIAAELTYATSVASITANHLTFTVDRGQGPQTIDYIWSGTPGEPLLRAIDDDPPVEVAEEVLEFGVEYDAIELVSNEDPPTIENPEQLFIQQDDLSTDGTPAQFEVSTNSKCGQSFLPAMPGNAVAWRITRAKFMADPDETENGELLVAVTNASGSGDPGGGVRDSVIVAESSLVHGTWHEVQFNADGELDPYKPHFITFARESGSNVVAMMNVDDGVTVSPGTDYYEDPGGGPWTQVVGRDLRLWVWGTISTPDPTWTQPPPDEEVHTVHLTLRTTSIAGLDALTTVMPLNRPVLAGDP